MNKGNFPLAIKNIQKFNKRLPPKLDREQEGLAKMLRKPRNNDSFKVLTTIYDYLERYFSYSEGLVACKKGCANCCHIQIILSKFEADFIALHTGLVINKIQPLFIPNSDGWVDPSKPCPFLKDNSCSIYSCRPMACRTHYNFAPTNEPCQFESKDKGMALINRETTFAGVMKAYSEHLDRHGSSVGDIRDFFGHASLAERVALRPIEGRVGADRKNFNDFDIDMRG
jgi:uncharacterized protein